MRFIVKSPSAARPSRQSAGCAGVRLSCSAYSAKVDTGFAKRIRAINELEHFLAANRNATLPENARCADLALVYGKGRGLSPVPGAFWGFLAAGFGRPEVGPPHARQGLGLGLPPGRDPGVVAGNQRFGDRLALE